MKSLLYSLAFILLLVAGALAFTKQRDPMAKCKQLIVVMTADWNSSQATLRRYSRGNIRMPWKPVGEPIAVMIGKNGLAWGKGAIGVNALAAKPEDPVKKEGDGRAPAGVFYLGRAFGYTTKPMPGWKMPYVYLNSSVECVDDSASKFYNQIIDRSTIAPDWNSSEQMLRNDDLYRWGVLVEHNSSPAQAGAGSCIFMHIWRGPRQPTVGCTAMPQADLESLIAWLNPASTPLLVQLPTAEYEKLREGWRWPQMKISTR
ncbi:MAG TPA: L,D-transpeptidase family protein [Candidatus Angelobacter sp.]|nr:L,D-transpeptidase family protein [Candidatus Angelobacter sp.]